jgi:hypothetical protein
MRLSDPRQETAAWALAQGETNIASARAAHVDRATVTKWRKQEPFSQRVDELRITLLKTDDGDPADAADQGLARLIPIAEAVIEAALKGEPYGAKVPSTQQHANALKTIELARKLEPKATGVTGAPSLGAMIEAADSSRAARAG